MRALRVYGCGAWDVNPFVGIFLGNVGISSVYYTISLLCGKLF